MEQTQELSLAEKKKEVLSKIQEVVEGFRVLKEELLEINKINEHLLLAKNRDEEKKKILQEASVKIQNLLKSIEQLKKNNAHRTNSEIHTAHSKISKHIWNIIEWIITETKLKTIITISVELPKLIEQLWKNLRTGIGIEILTESFEKFEKINAPIDLEKIKEKIESQISNIECRINDAQSIFDLIEYLELSDSHIINDLIDYILWGKTYDEINKKLNEAGVYIEQITLHPIDYVEEKNESLVNIPPPETPLVQDEIIPFQTPSTLPEVKKRKKWRIHVFIKTLITWINTDKTVSWRQAKNKILKELK